MPPMMMNPYKPVSPVGSPEFPIEPRASTMPIPRPPPRPPMSPGQDPQAALDFLTKVGRKGSGRQLLTSGALNATTSVNRDEALEMRPAVQAKQKQQLNAMLEQVRSLLGEFQPEAVSQPGAPTWQGLGDWIAERYPRFSGKWVPKEVGKRLREEYMAEQAARIQLYETQMRGYGAQMRGRGQPGRPAAMMEQIKQFFPPDVDPAIRKQKLEDVAGERTFERKEAETARGFKREQAKLGRAHDITLAGIKKPAVAPEKLTPDQAIVRAILAKEWDTVDDLLKKFPRPKDTEGKEKQALIKSKVRFLADLKRSRGEFGRSTPQDSILEEGLERDVGDYYGIDVRVPAPGAIDKVGEEMREGLAAMPTAPAMAAPTPPGAPAGRINEIAQWYHSLSEEEKKLFSAQVKKGAGGE